MSKEKKELLRYHIQTAFNSGWGLNLDDTPNVMQAVKKHMKQCPLPLEVDKIYSITELALMEETRQAMLDWITKGKS